VENGNDLVKEAGNTMHEIVLAIKRVTDLMAEIAAASEEQSSGIEQINSAVSQMDQTTQQNAALVEEASAAAESLREQSEMLSQAVSVFVLAGAEATAAATGSRPANPVRALPRKPAQPVPTKTRAARVKGAKQSPAAEDEWNEF
jgi:methyl-accepting chemotaxis protein